MIWKDKIMIIFLRRKGLGLGSLRGMVSYLNNTSNPKSLGVEGHLGENAGYVLNTKLETAPWDEFLNTKGNVPPTTTLIRWGCTSTTKVPKTQQLNLSPAIHGVSDKLGFRKLCAEVDGLAPKTWFSGKPIDQAETHWPVVIRPRHHHQGRNFYLANNFIEANDIIHTKKSLKGGYYISEFIEKAREFRVYVLHGYVVNVAEKIPHDPSQPAWNSAIGSTFVNVKWSAWPIHVIRKALKAMSLSSLDFGGVDLMTDKNNNEEPYVIEINSAPSLPLLSDGSISYRQKCMAKAFNYHAHHNYAMLKDNSTIESWKDCIHPGIRT